MGVRESEQLWERVDALQKQVADLKDAVGQAREENSEQVRARIQQIKEDIATRRESTREKTEKVTERAQSQWQSVKDDVTEKMHDLQERINRKRDELDIKMAEKTPRSRRRTPSVRWISLGGRSSRPSWPSLMR